MNTETGQKTTVIVEGSPDGVWIVGCGLDWDGSVVCCPRECFNAEHTRSEFNRPGIYILRGQAQDQQQPTIYIGEGDPVKRRLESHFAKKSFWEELFICVSGSGKLNKAHIQHLESRLVTLAKGANRCKLDNDVSPGLPTLTKAEADSVENYLRNLLFVLRVLGLRIFEQVRRPNGTKDCITHTIKTERSIPSLVIRGILKPNDRLHLIKNPRSGLNISEDGARHATFLSEEEIRWDLDGQAYSLSKLCKKICERYGGKLGSGHFQGPLYWAKEGQEISLADLSKSFDS